MDELVKPTSIKRLKTPILLRMWQEYAAALRSLPAGDPSSNSLREKLDQALVDIESQLLTRGVSRERQGMDTPITTMTA